MSLIIVGSLLILLCVAAYQDSRRYRIANKLVVPGAVLGVLFNTFLPEGAGFVDAISGWGVGLLLLLPLYLLRAMGAGDVKLMAMVGAFLGPQDILIALLYVFVTGGVLSVCVALYRGVLKKLFFDVQILIVEFITSLFTPQSKRVPQSFSFAGRMQDTAARMPYGVAIAVGTATFLAVSQLPNL